MGDSILGPAYPVLGGPELGIGIGIDDSPAPRRPPPGDRTPPQRGGGGYSLLGFGTGSIDAVLDSVNLPSLVSDAPPGLVEFATFADDLPSAADARGPYPPDGGRSSGFSTTAPVTQQSGAFAGLDAAASFASYVASIRADVPSLPPAAPKSSGRFRSPLRAYRPGSNNPAAGLAAPPPPVGPPPEATGNSRGIATSVVKSVLGVVKSVLGVSGDWRSWATQTDWLLPPPITPPSQPPIRDVETLLQRHWRLQPIVGVDLGNTPLNVLVNKVLLPVRNAELLPHQALSTLDQELRRSRFADVYEASQVLFPLERTMGLAAEVGPALEYLAASLPGVARTISAGALILVSEEAGAYGRGVGAGAQAGAAAEAGGSRLPARLAGWRAYTGDMSLPRGVKAMQGAPWDTGFPSGLARLGSRSMTASERVRSNRERGRAFQDAVQDFLKVTENQELVLGGVGSGRHYAARPDVLNAGTVADIKDVVDVRSTKQLRALADVAKLSDVPFSLVVSPRNNSISGAVVDAVESSGGLIVMFDERSARITSYLDLVSRSWVQILE